MIFKRFNKRFAVALAVSMLIVIVASLASITSLAIESDGGNCVVVNLAGNLTESTQVPCDENYTLAKSGVIDYLKLMTGENLSYLGGSGWYCSQDPFLGLDCYAVCCSDSLECIDSDLDGYYGAPGCGGSVDCRDDNESINPDSAEYCNNLDDDCDGQIDDEDACEVICSIDSDCGIDSCGEWYPICNDGDVWKTRDCYNSECVTGKCYETAVCETELVKDCINGCSDNECIPQACSADTDCGQDHCDNWANICRDGNVYKERTCQDISCLDSSCSSESYKEDGGLVLECDSGCEGGECKETSHITCYEDSDCGIDGLIGNKYCFDENLYQEYQSFFCRNPGSDISSCESIINLQKMQDCNSGCINDRCFDGTCDEDLDCGNVSSELVCLDDDVNTKYSIPACSNGTCSSKVNYNLVKHCSEDCSDGKCKGSKSQSKKRIYSDDCGNGKCDYEDGEDLLTCPIDCARAGNINLSNEFRVEGPGVVHLFSNEQDTIKLKPKILKVGEAENGYLIPLLLIGVFMALFLIILAIFARS